MCNEGCKKTGFSALGIQAIPVLRAHTKLKVALETVMFHTYNGRVLRKYTA